MAIAMPGALPRPRRVKGPFSPLVQHRVFAGLAMCLMATVLAASCFAFVGGAGQGRTRGAAAVALHAVGEVPGCKTTRETIKPGSGEAVVAKGKTVTVHATGIVRETGQKFWSTHDPGQEPFTYTAGVGGVIKGWDQGCLGMQVGEERRLIIPAEEGYGKGGFPAWGIPPGGTLDFTLECLSID
mmetsp:Transcript_9122/g.23849  ORF Transcript_9122/g.23849 Transcript_9122/m.23849 type:complete len:184 (+) Transcript_9122:54-605(+)